MSRTPFVHVGQLPERGTVVLPPEVVHHLRRVLRLADGADVVISDGAGRHAAGRLEGEAVVLAATPVLEPESAPRLVLVQAVPKGRALDDAVRLAVEVGVDAVVPFVSERGVVRPDASGARALVERARAVARAAAEQARRARVPDIDEVRDLDGLLAAIGPDDLVVVGVPGGPGPLETLAGRGGDTSRVLLVVGPEGGLTVAELERLEHRGALRMGLGPAILRSEHAGIALAAVTAALLGRSERVTTDPGPAASGR